jgi:hypothetical protein
MFSYSLLFLGVFFVIYNGIVFYQNFFKKNNKSWIPILGGCLIAVGMYLQKTELASSFWWIGLLIDWGCLPGFLYNFFLYKWIDPLFKSK